MIKTKVAGYDRMQFHRMEFFGRHGVFQEERALGQLWYVDLDLQIDLRQAGVSDDLSDSVNYADIFYLVKSIVEGQSFQLVEALTERIAAALLEAYPKINEATVRVTKPHPPFDIHFQGLTVEMTRVRDRDERHVDESGA
ncbi:dihydroneopterin aldolase [Paenibacillus apiarius]|uniref:7,8-dihydroneopterin aldolase n=1 Tax=Paenibacillus apiarius TaxID=46240 RepID=A0ABT4E2S4_9BACL|nr:dihydroneopterin aldolase [Paenibacillus apiarius]MCY9517370.1 dihydroneopterin aldolase [Paenibacillus apiarius]MCY9522828.1 dihydroneopterin aldolase [Paenibacillus apiarius]MCY9553069.1 dihydroneopterin aldolase [Paenibacillus apiarius]MCY9558766.1 dihydroneopterin aldolase [Paenibacillus apiarius]MCY9686257.1 dihydroneopterin aldolase [Paenibacillus apiarius]